MLLLQASKFLTQLVYLGGSTVHCVGGLDLSILDMPKPLSRVDDYDSCHSLELAIHLSPACGFQDLAHISIKL